ncbi:hypothetical protein N665_0725s0004, partial [Sinapis alba]
CEYPTLALVSKQLRSLVTSPEIYMRRSFLGVTEPCFYVLLYDEESGNNRWYFIHPKANGNHCLVLIQSLPAMNLAANFLAVDSRIYVFGGRDDHTKYRAVCINSSFHTVEHLWSMPMPMSHAIADIIDGKIYLIGDYYDMYMHNIFKSFVYEPNKNNWKKEEMLNSNKTCDPKQMYWGEVKGLGLQELVPNKRPHWIDTVSYSGKLALFCSYEISLERRQEGEIWGKVEWSDEVPVADNLKMGRFLAVMV